MKRWIKKYADFPHVVEACQYADDVIKGKIPACELVRQACERQRRDLRAQSKKAWPYNFDGKAANKACAFIEKLPHTKGKWARKRECIHLEPWQKFILTTLFGWVKKNGGLRRFKEAYCEIPRKNGKSVLASGIGLLMFCADGEFGAEVYSGATTEKQAWEVFRPAKQMVERTPDLKEYYGVEVNAKSMIRLDDASRFEPIVGKPGDGSSPSCAIVDEFHEHQDDDLYQTMDTGTDAREQPLIFIITTAGTNLAGPCYSKRGYVVDILKEVKRDERQFGIIYTIDEEDDWTDPDILRKANPNFGVSIIADNFLGSHATAIQSARKQNDFKTKRLNVWCGAKQAWMDLVKWRKAPPRKTLDELEGRPCYIGLDLASKEDVASMAALFPPIEDDPVWHLHLRQYLPEDRAEDGNANADAYAEWAKQGHLILTDGAIIDFDYIVEELDSFKSRFQVEEIAYDPFQATWLATTLTKDGYPMVELGATVKNFSEPMKTLQALVKVHLLAHGGDPVLEWMVSNVVAKLDKKDNIFPDKEAPERKIDGIVAAIMAMGRAMLNVENDSFWE